MFYVLAALAQILPMSIKLPNLKLYLMAILSELLLKALLLLGDHALHLFKIRVILANVLFYYFLCGLHIAGLALDVAFKLLHLFLLHKHRFLQREPLFKVFLADLIVLEHFQLLLYHWEGFQRHPCFDEHGF